MKNPRARETLDRLMAGNRRFVHDEARHPRSGSQRRQEIAGGQKPVAAVLGCADSRVVPELIFDQGMGDLFVVRIAGNVIDPAVTESMEYAAFHLDVPLFIILGHSSCGAVTSVAQTRDIEERPSRLSEFIGPAVDDAKGGEGDLIDGACRNNARLVATELTGATRDLTNLVEDGHLDIVPAYYHLDDGTVEIL